MHLPRNDALILMSAILSITRPHPERSSDQLWPGPLCREARGAHGNFAEPCPFRAAPDPCHRQAAGNESGERRSSGAWLRAGISAMERLI